MFSNKNVNIAQHVLLNKIINKKVGIWTDQSIIPLKLKLVRISDKLLITRCNISTIGNLTCTPVIVRQLNEPFD